MCMIVPYHTLYVMYKKWVEMSSMAGAYMDSLKKFKKSSAERQKRGKIEFLDKID